MNKIDILRKRLAIKFMGWESVKTFGGTGVLYQPSIECYWLKDTMIMEAKNFKPDEELEQSLMVLGKYNESRSDDIIEFMTMGSEWVLNFINADHGSISFGDSLEIAPIAICKAVDERLGKE